MSSSRTLSVSADTVRGIKIGGAANLVGCGQSKHYYVGRYAGGNYDYTSYIKFTLDWSNVGKIVSATLNLTVDEFDTFGTAGEIGIFPAPVAGNAPTVLVCQLISAFTVGSSPDGSFVGADYTNPNRTTTGQVEKALTPIGADQLNTIDITDIVRAWAPSTVEGGGANVNHGIALYGKQDATKKWSGWSSKHTGGGGAAERATITLIYELGATVPNTPTLTTPSGNVATLSAGFQGTFSDVRSTDTLQSAEIEIYSAGNAANSVAATQIITSTAHGLIANNPIYFTAVGTSGLTVMTPYYVLATGFTPNSFAISTSAAGTAFNIAADSAVTWARLVGSFSKTASQSETVAAAFTAALPTGISILAAVTYQWRARVADNEGQTSAWSALLSFVLTNTAPNAPTLSPANGSSYATLNLIKFTGGTFSDPDGDKLGSFQIQLSPYASGDVRWDSGAGNRWDSGQIFVPTGATSWSQTYGGSALAAGTYYWRARHWDARQSVSAWTYAQIILSAAFNPDPASYTKVQVNPVAPWRILIRDLFQADGVTPTTGRAPGNLIAVFEEAKNVGASIVYNSPGELHFTLLKDDPQLPLVEPKQTHYAVEFYSGDGWQEKYAGVIWDVDATEVDVVFKGIDYLALYDTVVDERYDPLSPEKSYASGGSKYTNVTIRNVILDQLNRAKGLADSWVGFITIGNIDAMDELVTVYSTMQPVLSFVASLIDSHRQGTGKRTRVKVIKTTGGGYELQIADNPGIIRSDLALYYGELVQGYRLIVFGDGWANVQHVVGRNRDGVKVTYSTISGQAFQPSQSVYGRIATVAVFDGVNDSSDLSRRGLQAAIQAAKLGKQVAIGIRTQYLQPLQGWDITDVFPLTIKDGAIDTTLFGSGYWVGVAAAWEATDIGEQSLVITFLPREDTSSPNANLLVSSPISTQAEWQLGWIPPDPLNGVTSTYYLDQSSKVIYTRQSDGSYIRSDWDPLNANGLVNAGFQITPVATRLTKVWTSGADWATALSATNLNTADPVSMTTSTY